MVSGGGEKKWRVAGEEGRAKSLTAILLETTKHTNLHEKGRGEGMRKEV